MFKEKQIIRSLRKDLEDVTPNILDSVMNAPVTKMQMHDAITRQPVIEESQTQRRAFRFAPALGAVLTLLVLAFTGWYQVLRVDSLVGVDVNPSIEIQINSLDRVVSLKALNVDAIPIIGGIAYKQVKVQNVVHAVLGSLYQHGYLQDAESAILITVENTNKDKAERLENELVIEIQDMVRMPSSKVFSQTLPHVDMKEEANKHKVSLGVMHLATEARRLNPALSLDELTKMPLNDLYLLAHGLEVPAETETDNGGALREREPVGEETELEEAEYHNFLPIINSGSSPGESRNIEGVMDDDDDDAFDDDLFDDDEWDDDEWDDD